MTSEESAPVSIYLDEFLAFARGWLRNNLPSGFDFSGSTPAMRFQDGEILPIVSFPPGESPGMDGVASGTAINAHARRDGRGDTVATPAWGVTGNDGKK